MKSAKQLARLIDAMGLSTESDESGLSGSQYVTVTLEAGNVYKLRMSDHEMRPTYGLTRGYADFEIGNHQDADGDWKAAIRWLANKTGRKPVFALRNSFNLRGLKMADAAAMHCRWLADEMAADRIAQAWGSQTYNEFWNAHCEQIRGW